MFSWCLNLLVLIRRSWPPGSLDSLLRWVRVVLCLIFPDIGAFPGSWTLFSNRSCGRQVSVVYVSSLSRGSPLYECMSGSYHHQLPWLLVSGPVYLSALPRPPRCEVFLQDRYICWRCSTTHTCFPTKETPLILLFRSSARLDFCAPLSIATSLSLKHINVCYQFLLFKVYRGEPSFLSSPFPNGACVLHMWVFQSPKMTISSSSSSLASILLLGLGVLNAQRSLSPLLCYWIAP